MAKHKTGKISVGDTTGVIKITEGDPNAFPRERIPEGWVERAPGEWVPQWPECRYRALNIVLPNKDKIEITPVCLYNGKETGGRGEIVSHEVCCACTIHQPLIPLVTHDQADAIREGRAEAPPLAVDIVEARQDDLARIASAEDIMGQLKKEIDGDPNKAISKAQSRQFWKPCDHREVEESDCCPKATCRCEACPLFNKRITKKDCETCEHREDSR